MTRMQVIVVGKSTAHRHNILPIRPEPRPRPSTPRAATVMSVFLLVPFVIMMSLASRIPGATAQGTGAICNSGFDWMINSKGQSPCLVSSWLFTPCSSPSDSWVDPLPSGCHYATPLNTTESANPCRCNTVLFSTIAACATCQDGAEDIVPWLLYSQNCSTVYVQQYPENIPSGTAIPAWAYLDITTNGTIVPAAAQAVAAQHLPESTAPAVASPTSEPNATSQTSESSGSAMTSPSTATNGVNGTPNATGDTSNSGSKKSSAGPIIGGVVGGVAGIALISLGVFFILRSRRNSAPGGNYGQHPEHANYGTDTQSWEKSSVTPQDPSQLSVSTHRLYGPNFDPRTFPAQYPSAGFAQASTRYLATEHASAGVVSGNYTDGYLGRGVTTQNPYRGAPEL